MEEPPPGGCATFVVLRSLIQLPMFWFEPQAYALDEASEQLWPRPPKALLPKLPASGLGIPGAGPLGSPPPCDGADPDTMGLLGA